MTSFFCMSRDQECIDVAIAMVGAIAKKTKSSQKLFLKVDQPTAKQFYPLVEITTQLPQCLRSTLNRPVYEDILLEGGETYFNVWPFQMRGYYCRQIAINPLLKLMTDQAKGAGLNIKLKESDILYSGLKEKPKIKLPPKHVCLTPRALYFLGKHNVDLRTFVGSLDIFSFYIPSSHISTFNVRNVKWISDNDFPAALYSARTVVTELPSEAMHYNNFFRKKEVVSLSKGSSANDIISCKNIHCVGVDTLHRLQSAIKKALS